VDNPYWRVLAAQVRSQTQYRASFALDLVASGLFTTLDVATVLLLFSLTGGLGGFGGREVLLVTGLAACGFPIGELVAGNADRLRNHVRTGLFDTVLLRPMSALGQLIVMDFQPRRFGRVVQGLVLYGVALGVAGIAWTPGRVLLAVLAPVAGAAFFASLFVATSTVVFWWIESGEITAAVTYAGRDFTSYPVTMYGEWFRGLFAFGLGFAFVAYFPALALLGRADPIGTPEWLHWCSPLVALPAAAVAGLLWRTGIRHYRSTGS
jgi:ABC-2 type transport system permease protein